MPFHGLTLVHREKNNTEIISWWSLTGNKANKQHLLRHLFQNPYLRSVSQQNRWQLQQHTWNLVWSITYTPTEVVHTKLCMCQN
jgi:hypothetical protein